MIKLEISSTGLFIVTLSELPCEISAAITKLFCRRYANTKSDEYRITTGTASFFTAKTSDISEKIIITFWDKQTAELFMTYYHKYYDYTTINGSLDDTRSVDLTFG